MMTHKAVPFLKWAGGKTQLLNEIIRRFPYGVNRYVEPFIGAGAVFFEVAQRFVLNEYYISDVNKDLILSYKVIRDNVNELTDNLNDLYLLYTKSSMEEREKLYYNLREQFNNTTTDDIDRATQFIFLNKSCFNGIFRVNSSGKFNVPFGYNKLLCIDKNNLKRISALLNRTNVYIQSFDFTECSQYIDENTFVYLDPPYYTSTNNFTSYTALDFHDKDHMRLADFYKLMDKRGAKLMLNNSSDSFLKTLYSGYSVDIVDARRSINCNGNNRGTVSELIITNYKPERTERKMIQSTFTI